MLQIIEKVTKELEKLGLTMETVENEHILEACTAKVALVDNLSVEDLNLKSAGEAFVALSHYANDESEILTEITKEDATAIVKGLSDNPFVIDLIGETVILDVPDEDKEVFTSAIESLTDISDEDRATLLSMFNLK